MGLLSWLAGSRAVPSNPSIQPNLAHVPAPVYLAGSITRFHAPVAPVSTAVMETGIVGYNTPNIVNIYGAPNALPAWVTSGAPQTRSNNAPNGGC